MWYKAIIGLFRNISIFSLVRMTAFAIVSNNLPMNFGVIEALNPCDVF